MQCLTMLFTTESSKMNDQIRKHKRREQSTGQKARRFFVEVFSFDPKASLSRALKVTLLKRGLNCNNSYFCSSVNLIDREDKCTVMGYS